MTEIEARNHFDLVKDSQSWKVFHAQKELLETGPSKKNISNILYRPFDFRFTYFNKKSKSKGFLGRPLIKVMSHMASGENIALCLKRQPKVKSWTHCLVTDEVSDSGSVSGGLSVSSHFPLYTSKLNLSTDIQNLLTQIYKQPIEKLARPFFNYIYAVFHSPSFRNRYVEFLKQDFPRVQITTDKKLFFKLSELGEQLIELHLMHVDGTSSEFKGQGDNLIQKVMWDNGRVYINTNQFFSNVDKETFEFQIGGYRPLQKWLKDRKNQTLNPSDISHYAHVVEALKRTQKIMTKIDDVINKAGGWPLAREENQKAA